MKRGFSTFRYIKEQKKEIQRRIRRFDRLYLEFGGKLIFDSHASRVLPGYDPESKIKIVMSLKKKEIIYCVNARDIQKGRIISDFKLLYENHALKDLQKLKSSGLKVSHLVITRFSDEPKALDFADKISKMKIPVYFHSEIKGYPSNINLVMRGLSNQPYIPVKNKIIVVTGTASGSGKMSVALSQIFHERKLGIASGFAKNETFPIWDLPLTHPINMAYEAATADLQDYNMIDPYHKKAYNVESVNYNRDIQNFKILMKISSLITKEKNAFGYRSPTDMGINMAKKGIIEEEICIEAARKEIARRYYDYLKNLRKGRESKKTMSRMNEILKKAGLNVART